MTPWATGGVRQADRSISQERRGTGNQVVDCTSGGGAGDVVFTPWISGAVGSLANPLVINTPSPVAFQFTEASNTYFLGQGVGNLNDPPPFTVSTANGLLQVGGATGTSLGAYIGSDKKLTATFTPNAEGPATVSVAGPCGLQGSAVTAVVAPKIAVTKTVGTVAGVCATTQSIQVPQNTPIYYCVTVEERRRRDAQLPPGERPAPGRHHSRDIPAGARCKAGGDQPPPGRAGSHSCHAADHEHRGRHLVRLVDGAQRLGQCLESGKTAGSGA